jgi:cell division protein FtsB
MAFSRNIMFIGGITVLFMLLFLIIFSHDGIVDFYHLSKEKSYIVSDNLKIEKKNLNLIIEINRLKNDKEYIEHVAKHEFGMANLDEFVFRTISNKGTSIRLGMLGSE